MVGDYGIVPINGGRTLAVHVVRWRRADSRDCWAFLGEGAEGIPEGYGPLPKASFGVRGDVFVGDFARP
jgi:hypothetical protein